MSEGVDIRQASPSETALSDSNLNKKALCDYTVNPADGCPHGCEFCLNKGSPQYVLDPGGKLNEAGVRDPQGDWGDYALYRYNLPQHLQSDVQTDAWTTTRRGQGVTMLSIGTDPYFDRRVAQISGAAVTILGVAERPTRVLTRQPLTAARLHGQLYQTLAERELVTVGASIPSLDEERVDAIEPDAPSIDARLKGLAQFDRLEVPTYVSMSPTYPTASKDDLRELVETIVDHADPTVIFTEPINPAADNFEDCIRAAEAAGCEELRVALSAIADGGPAWIQYALQNLAWSQEIAEDLGVPIHLWPAKKLASQAPTAQQREWCEAWRARPSPEAIGEGDACTDPYPEVPRIDAQQTFDEVGQT